jgi:hypothetical protein
MEGAPPLKPRFENTYYSLLLRGICGAAGYYPENILISGVLPEPCNCVIYHRLTGFCRVFYPKGHVTLCQQSHFNGAL